MPKVSLFNTKHLCYAFQFSVAVQKTGLEMERKTSILIVAKHVPLKRQRKSCQERDSNPLQ